MNDKEIEEIMLGMVREKAAKLYSKKVISYGVHPRNYGAIEKPDGYASVTNDCGETLEIFLAIRNGRIDQATFMTDGCLFTIAAGSAAADMAKGKKNPGMSQDKPELDYDFRRDSARPRPLRFPCRPGTASRPEKLCADRRKRRGPEAPDRHETLIQLQTGTMHNRYRKKSPYFQTLGDVLQRL